jgi:hypothetical protein
MQGVDPRFDKNMDYPKHFTRAGMSLKLIRTWIARKTDQSHTVNNSINHRISRGDTS